MNLISFTWRNTHCLKFRDLGSPTRGVPLQHRLSVTGPLVSCASTRTVRSPSASSLVPFAHTTETSAMASAASTTAAATPAAPPSEEPAGMEAEAALLTAFSEVPAFSKAVVRSTVGGSVMVSATLQQRNLAGNSQRRYNITAALPPSAVQSGAAGPMTALLGLPQELSPDVAMTSVAPSGRQQLVVLKGPNDTASALLQVWRNCRLVLELSVPKTLHGPLVNDGYFGSGAAWSHDETAVVYVAETPAPERTPSWSSTTASPSNAAVGAGDVPKAGDSNGTSRSKAPEGAAPRSWRGQGATAEDWGELNTGKRPPGLFMLDLSRAEVVQVSGLPDEHSFGLPAWCPPTRGSAAGAGSDTGGGGGGGSLSGLVLVAWPHCAPPSFPRLAAAANPRKLGVVFCYNRSAHLYHIAVQRGPDGVLQFGSSAARLCPSLESALSPTFSPGGDALVFVSHSEAVATGTHGGTARLYRLDWSPETGAPITSEPTMLVDVVTRPAAPSAFPGLYTANIPDNGFVGPTTLLLNTQWGAVGAIVAVDIAAGGPTTPVPLTPVEPSLPLATAASDGSPSCGGGNWSLVGVAGGLVVAARAAPDTPLELCVATLPEYAASLTAPAEAATALSWRPMGLSAPAGDSACAELPDAVQAALKNLKYEVLRVQPRVGDTSLGPFDCLVWRPADREGPLPTVITPHGGPHTAITLGWYPAYAYLTALGYAVLSPNYRGSTGYGQAALASLPGAIGRQDVDDCMAAVAAGVDAGLVDPNRVSVVGGSHGGFLTGHLLGQFPYTFRSGVMRNPVTNISAMVAASDIPDWCYVEVFGCEEGRRRCAPVPIPADLTAMYEASPVLHVDRVNAPVFVMLGARDRRVPPPDGLQYLAALRGRDTQAAGGPPPPTRLIVFPEDTHGLDKPQTEYEQWINVVWWLKMYAGAKQEVGTAAAPVKAAAEPAV